MSRTLKSIDTESRLLAAMKWREEGIKKYGLNESVLKLDSGDDCKHCEDNKIYKIVHFKVVNMVSYMLCDLK